MDLDRSTRLRTLVGGVAVLAAGVWAFWPLHGGASGTTVNAPSTPATPGEIEARPVFNTAAFAAQLWSPTPIPPPPPAPVVVQAPPPLRLQLIGITRDTPKDGTTPVLRAALYDPDSDRLLLVAAGETLTAGRGSVTQLTVASLTADTIELTDGTLTRSLSLKDAASPTPTR